jgi:hypothetical protein
MTRAKILVAALLAAWLLHAGGAAAGDSPAAPQRAGGDAQAAPAPDSPPISWLPAYHFHMSASSLRSDDPRFDWDAHFGGDIDLVDYGVGRLNLLADYAVVIGSEIRAIDPNQGAYHLAVSASWRCGATEVQPVFDHVSRHLSDRSNDRAVSWNAVGAAVTTRRQHGALSVTVGAQAARTVQAAFVDYTWLLGTGIDATHRFSRRGALVARADVAPILVDRTVAGRTTQVAISVEGGLRLLGSAAAMELFAGWQRRVDPWPLERSTAGFPVVGFRFVNR